MHWVLTTSRTSSKHGIRSGVQSLLEPMAQVSQLPQAVAVPLQLNLPLAEFFAILILNLEKNPSITARSTVSQRTTSRHLKPSRSFLVCFSLYKKELGLSNLSQAVSARAFHFRLQDSDSHRPQLGPVHCKQYGRGFDGWPMRALWL